MKTRFQSSRLRPSLFHLHSELRLYLNSQNIDSAIFPRNVLVNSYLKKKNSVIMVFIIFPLTFLETFPLNFKATDTIFVFQNVFVPLLGIEIILLITKVRLTFSTQGQFEPPRPVARVELASASVGAASIFHLYSPFCLLRTSIVYTFLLPSCVYVLKNNVQFLI